MQGFLFSQYLLRYHRPLKQHLPNGVNDNQAPDCKDELNPGKREEGEDQTGEGEEQQVFQDGPKHAGGFVCGSGNIKQVVCHLMLLDDKMKSISYQQGTKRDVIGGKPLYRK